MNDEIVTRDRPRDSISWRGQEYFFIEKSPDWFWTLGIIAIAGAVAAAIWGNVLFAILILVGAFALAMFAARQPEEVSFEISPKGIRTGDTLYPYPSLDVFWVEHEDEEEAAKLLVRSKKLMMPLIVVPLPGYHHPEDIRNYLLHFLPEEHLEEPFFHRIMDALGF